MHFSKTYAQLLLNLPPELRENAIQYRQLKKLINQIVRELSSLGLSPALLQELLERSKEESDELVGRVDKKLAEEADRGRGGSPSPQRKHFSRVVYEVTDDSGHIEPHLRLWVDSPSRPSSAAASSLRLLDDLEEAESSEQLTPAEPEGEDNNASKPPQGQTSLLWALQKQAWMTAANEQGRTEPTSAHITEVSSSESDATAPANQVLPSLDSEISSFDPECSGTSEVVIPLAADLLFFQTLSTAINDLSAHLVTMQSDFVDTLNNLSRTIGDSARPISMTSSGFRPHSSLTSKPWSVSNATKAKSDLYAWREIFQLYVEAEVFESVHELDRGERSVEESQHRLEKFAERVTARGLGDKRRLKSKASREALESFLELNLFILNIKKFQFANAEATRKILKKHTKRTSLPFLNDDASSKAIIPHANAAAMLPRILVQAIGETVLPVIPHLDDYSCLICTSIAFKPIRLNCGHLFCVRCLVKMQKRGNGDCPMCRSPCVLTADRTNVDWALLNFMQDWFPVESREKLLQNEKETAREEIEELGLDPDRLCRIM